MGMKTRNMSRRVKVDADVRREIRREALHEWVGLQDDKCIASGHVG